MSNWLGYFIKLIWTFFEKPGLFTEVNAVNFVGSQDTTVIEMCALVDFLLDIVSIETYVWAHQMCSRILNLRIFFIRNFLCFLLLMLLACHKKSYLICDEITNFRNIMQYLFIFKQLSLLCFGCLSFVLWKKIGIGCVNIRKFVISSHIK